MNYFNKCLKTSIPKKQILFTDENHPIYNKKPKNSDMPPLMNSGATVNCI